MLSFLNCSCRSLIASVVSVVLVSVGVLYVSVSPLHAQVQVPTTVAFDLMKKFSGSYPVGYSANQFTFNITGITNPVTLTPFTVDTATAVVDLPIGTYTISENGPAGFVPADWTVQWSGAGCQDLTGESTTITVEERHLGLSNFGCRADNQWKPENPDEDPDPITGTLLVSKVIVGTTTVPTSDFSFTYTGAAANIAFELDGTNALSLATGTYAVTEVTALGYTATYSNCSNIAVVAGATTTACVITNTLSSSNGGGGDDSRYLIFGYVWHDANENDNWEMNESNSADNESDLDGWTVEITNGTTAYTTTTDSTGYYSFYVTVGTWTINEVLQSGWTKTFPNVNGHIVAVTGPITQAPHPNFFSKLTNYVLPTAYAEILTQYGPFDFGNVFFGSGGGNGNGGNGNGGSSSGSRSNRSTDTGGQGGGSMADPAPMPLVLGETTSVLPVGAPNTGAGGTSPVNTTAPSLFAILTTVVAVRKTK